MQHQLLRNNNNIKQNTREMNVTKLDSGDCNKIMSTEMKETISLEVIVDNSAIRNPCEVMKENTEIQHSQSAVTPTIIDENETNLKERIAQCKNIIASLKLELNEEKHKLEDEAKQVQVPPSDLTAKPTDNVNTSENFSDHNSNIYTACVDSKLHCDENLMEYEKQLQRYQNTLNMAQIEKKNAIRKQMLAKAFKLKLMEVENQCNIELLRIKQSLQCLEPLQMIVEKWKINSNDNVYDLNNFKLIPRYPELSATSGSDIANMSGLDDNENKIAISNIGIEKQE